MLLTEQEWKIWSDNSDKVTKEYAPPQLQPDCLPSGCLTCDCVVHKSCWAPLCFCHNSKTIDVTEVSDDFLTKMLETESEKCPEHLRGVWWMADNIVHERFLTFADADWQNENYAIKSMKTNWSHNSTCQGSVLSCLLGCLPLNMEMEVSDDKKWVVIKYAGEIGWMGLVEEEIKYGNDWWKEEFRNKVGVEKDDLYRVTYEDYLNPKSRLKYQYAMKRVAYKSKNGDLLKTASWDEYLRRCRLRREGNSFIPENPKQIVRYTISR